MTQKRIRRILPLELKQLNKLSMPAEKAREELEDAQLVVNEKKAAFDTVSAPFIREGRRLVKKYGVKPDEEIHRTTGEIRKRHFGKEEAAAIAAGRRRHEALAKARG